MDLKATLKYLRLASLITAAATGRNQTMENRPAHPATAERFPDFIARVVAITNSARQQRSIISYVRKAALHGHAAIEDSTVYLFYYGKAHRVFVAGDPNGWNPSSNLMTRVKGTNLFYLALSAQPESRFEYKLVVDSTWILDPINSRQSMGGYGPNSEIWMPRYSPPSDIIYRTDIPHGSLDTSAFKSASLGRTYPVFVYTPPGYQGNCRFPVVFVTDGGEYLSLGLMQNVLDNLIADRRISPIIAVFVDPRTNIRDQSTNQRMVDYAMNDAFVRYLTRELRPLLLRKYRMAESPESTCIIGASMGGLIATYAAIRRPDVFGLCAAQSPAYWWNNDSILTLMKKEPRKDVRFYIDTGTIKDAREKANAMSSILREKGYPLAYAEYPEGHNWGNWRARLANILTLFWGKE